jgi:hypothetical protein
MTSPEDSSGPQKKLDPVPFWIMGVIVLVVIGIIIYGP